jgi:DNA-binding winged helix-turn-helix (wHTH) protein/tetratricopeptide (TPR) repeat protein
MNEIPRYSRTALLDGSDALRTAARPDSQYLAHRPDFNLGAATIHPSVRTIDGPDGITTVEPRVMQVLLALADANGAVVTRKDLINDCWNGQIVGDDAINRAIGEVRKVARATGAGFGVETIPRIGYRLTGFETSQQIGEKTDEAASNEKESSEPILPRRLLIAGGLATALTGIAFWRRRSTTLDPALSLIDESRIAMQPGTPVADRRAISLLEKAVELSPDNAQAWGLLALTRARADEHASDKLVSPVDAVANDAHRALLLDENNADAKTALAISVPYYGDWSAAEKRFETVLKQHPDHLFALDSYSFFLGAVGRIQESAKLRLSIPGEAPLDANFRFRSVYALWFQGRNAEADRRATQGLEMWPRHAGFWFARLWVLASTGRFDRALAHIGDTVARPPMPAAMVATLAAAVGAAQSRKPDDLAMASDRVMKGVQQSVAAVVNAIMLLNLMGETDRAFDLAEAYYLEQGPIIAAMQWRRGQPIVPDQRRRKTNMLFAPTSEPMRKDSRFVPLVQRMGLFDYWSRRNVTPDFLS